MCVCVCVYIYDRVRSYLFTSLVMRSEIVLALLIHSLLTHLIWVLAQERFITVTVKLLDCSI